MLIYGRLILPVLAFLALAAPNPAGAATIDRAHGPVARAAYSIGGTKWPGGRITYWNGSKRNRKYVAAAVRAWNASGIRVRFRAASKRRARVWILNDSGQCSGFAQIGYSRYVRRARVHLGAPSKWCDDQMRVIVAHELGHILGLGHENRRCALMNSAVWLHCATPKEGWRTRCRLFETDDLRGAKRRYGGRVKKPGKAFCDKWA